jgi:hypothetical protein
MKNITSSVKRRDFILSFSGLSKYGLIASNLRLMIMESLDKIIDFSVRDNNRDEKSN